jgi:hypothetical protein
VVAVGQGNGGGLAAARHLRPGRVGRIILARPVNRLRGRPHLATLLEMAVDCCVAIYDVEDVTSTASSPRPTRSSMASSAYGAAGAPGTAWPGSWIDWLGRPCRSSAGPAVGMDPDTGEAPGGDPRRRGAAGAAVGDRHADLALPGRLLAAAGGRVERLPRRHRPPSAYTGGSAWTSGRRSRRAIGAFLGPER